MNATAYRLTDNDEHLAGIRMGEVTRQWMESSTTGRVNTDAVNVESLVRVGAHAIGCSTADLRDVELDWLRTKAIELLRAVS